MMISLKEARYQEPINLYSDSSQRKVQCHLCPNECVLKEDQSGICRKRINKNGVLMTETYGNICAAHIDPIEKKPLYHFYPGSSVYSIGANSCNLKCQFCQNYEISQFDVPVIYYTPEHLLDNILKSSCDSLAFTYSEPLMMIEFILDCLPLLKSNNIKTIMVSNAFVNEEPLLELLNGIDAWNVDLKSISNEFYKSVCSANVHTVMKNIKLIAQKTHIEISFLVIPGLNDSINEINDLSAFIASVNPDIPLHINRYHPAYHMNRPATPIDTLIKLYHVAKQRLSNVYLGNTGLSEFNQTYCPECNQILIKRDRYDTSETAIRHNRCSNCDTPVYGCF